MSDNNDLSLVYSMLRDLTQKVDMVVANQVTRHEFDNLGKRLDAMMVKAEFDVYRQAHDQWAQTVVANLQSQLNGVIPRQEQEQKWDEVDGSLSELKRSRGAWKSWVPSLLSALGAIASAVFSIFHPHP